MKTKILLGVIIAALFAVYMTSQPSSASTAWAPGVPTGLMVDQANPTLSDFSVSWNAVTGALRYHVQIDDNSNFSSPELDLSNITSASLDVDATGLITSSATYYIRVRACNNDEPECSAFSGAISTFVQK